MTSTVIYREGKRYVLHLVSNIDNIKRRITSLRRQNPYLKYRYYQIGFGRWALYVRRWGR